MEYLQYEVLNSAQNINNKNNKRKRNNNFEETNIIVPHKQRNQANARERDRTHRLAL